MKLDILLGEKNLRAAVEELLAPYTSTAPAEKGPNAIKVSGYVVHGHWRRRTIAIRPRTKFRRVK